VSTSSEIRQQPRTLRRLLEVNRGQVQNGSWKLDPQSASPSQPRHVFVCRHVVSPGYAPSHEVRVRHEMMVLEVVGDHVSRLRGHLDGNHQVRLHFVEHPGEVARIDEASEEVDGGESERLHLRDPRVGRRTAASRHYLQ